MPDYPPSLQQDIDRLPHQGSVPDHVAIIMDGNGRWARRQGLSIPEGHREGVKRALDIADLCGELEAIDVLTLYAFSTENWARPDEEVDALMDLLVEFLRKEVDRMVRNNVRFETIGDLSPFRESVRQELDRTKRLTRDNDQFVLNLALNYGSRNEMTRAVRSLARDVARGELDPESIDPSRIESRLDTADLPDPDLVIRTSGEERLSNFLLWQVAYSEIFFTEDLWPEFDERAFLDALVEFQGRERRFGDRVPTQV